MSAQDLIGPCTALCDNKINLKKSEDTKATCGSKPLSQYETDQTIRYSRGESDHLLVVQMIAPTGCVFQGFSLAAGIHFKEKFPYMGVIFS